jgi:hypothetical protein
MPTYVLFIDNPLSTWKKGDGPFTPPPSLRIGVKDAASNRIEATGSPELASPLEIDERCDSLSRNYPLDEHQVAATAEAAKVALEKLEEYLLRENCQLT